MGCEVLLFRKVAFTNRGILLHIGQFTARDHFASCLVDVLDIHVPCLGSFWVLGVNVNDVLGPFNHRPGRVSRLITHPLKLITGKVFFHRFVILANRRIMLNTGRFTIRQNITLGVNVSYIYVPCLWGWNRILGVAVNDVLGVRQDLPADRRRRLVHADEVVAGKTLFCRRVVGTDHDVRSWLALIIAIRYRGCTQFSPVKR